MGTCVKHGTDLVPGFGEPFCPACEAEGVEAQVAAGTLPSPALGYMAVPVDGKKLISIRFDEHDLERARLLAKRKKLPYQTYLRLLLKSALDIEEKKYLSDALK